jgi:8-oxo-dGTP pyrophosphatase MutT (NUDIX family)
MEKKRDQNKWRQLSYVSCVGDKLNIDLDNDFFGSMGKIEKAHWNYIDNYCSSNTFYPRLSFYQFMEEIFKYKNLFAVIPYIKDYGRLYDKYKKSMPTAGALIIYRDPHHASRERDQILLVNITGSQLYTLPKGKQDPGDLTLEETAAREVKEETGLDISDIICYSDYYNVHKTRFYIVETDELITQFQNYNKNEIAHHKWFSFEYVLANPAKFSKQVRSAVKLLL